MYEVVVMQELLTKNVQSPALVMKDVKRLGKALSQSQAQKILQVIQIRVKLDYNIRFQSYL